MQIELVQINHVGARNCIFPLGLFKTLALLELGMESTDGTGATLAFPLVLSSAALLTEVAEGEDAGPSQPADISPSSGPGRL